MNTDPKPRPPNAYLLNLSVENLRCFGERQRLDLSDGEGRPARWTVILGDNGVGKTSLLQAVAIMGLPFQVQPNSDDFVYFKNPLYWLHWSFFRTSHRQPSGVSAEFSTDANLTHPLPQGRRLTCGLQWRDDSHGLNPNHPELADWQCFGYGALRRSGLNVKLSGGTPDCNSETLFRDDAELINAEEWLLQADYAAARAKRKETGAAERLTLVKRTLVDILPDVQDICIEEPEAFGLNPKIVFRTGDGTRSLETLGLGYRTTIAWLVDLAARMVQRYPESTNPIAEPAVVLVDEIDLHLHPAWQRTLMTFLSERFVNTQFIVTAHSPVVVQAAEGANIAVLRREGDQVVIDQRKRSVQGWRVDQLLTSDLFDLPSARPARYDDLLAERRGLLEKRRLTAKDKARLSILEDQMKELPSGDHPDDADALRIIREAAALITRQEAAPS